MKRKIVIIVLIVILVFSFGTFLVLNDLTTNTKEVELVSSLIEKENKLEDDFPKELKDIDNADVVVNPYEISPLTALIIFKSKASFAV